MKKLRNNPKIKWLRQAATVAKWAIFVILGLLFAVLGIWQQNPYQVLIGGIWMGVGGIKVKNLKREKEEKTRRKCRA